MKFEATLTTTLEEVIKSVRYNQSVAAEIVGVTRGTLRKYLEEPEKVLLVQIDGKLTPFVSDRRNGHYKKEVKNG